MSKLEYAIYELNKTERQSGVSQALLKIDTRAKILVTFLFLIMMLSMPLLDISRLILFAVFPVLLSPLAGIGYASIARRSLIALPFVVFIGIFNPLLDTRPMYHIGNITISAGWVSFMSIILRGLLATQAVILLILSSGFHNICYALNRLGVPSIFTTQLLLVHHYTFILLKEALSMHRARSSRSFGKSSYSLKTWGVFIGQLLLRTIRHGSNVYRAMTARGFTGRTVLAGNRLSWSAKDALYAIIASTAIILLRFTNLFML